MKAWIWALAALASAAPGFAQCDSNADPVPVTSATVQTVGGITSVQFTYHTYCPFELWKKPVLVQGTNIIQRIWLVPDFYVACPAVYPPMIYEMNATIVLGQFPAGEYLCKLITPNSISGPRFYHIPFTVPEPSPTLALLPAPAGQIAFCINGVSNATYRVESSLDLTNWTTFRTVTGTPFTMTNQPGATTFYRVLVSDKVPVCP